MADVIAKLGLDTRPYETKLDGLGAINEKWAQKQKKFLAGNFLKAFGLGTVVAFVNSQIEAQKKLQQEAGKYGKSVEEMQALADVADKTGLAVDDLVKNIERMPADIKAAVAEFRAFQAASTEASDFWVNLGKGFKNNPLTGFVEAAVRKTTQVLSLVSNTGSGLASWVAGALTGNRIGDTEGDSFINAFLAADELRGGGYDSGARTERMTATLAQKRMARIKDEEQKKSQAASSGSGSYGPQTFDSLNRIGGFAAREGAFQGMVFDRIANASERTARNTEGLNGL